MTAILALVASPADAHPLGNFTVNQYEGLTFSSSRVQVDAAVDTAEIPTLQDRSAVDTNGDRSVTDQERAAYAATACADLAAAFEVRIEGSGWPGRWCPVATGTGRAPPDCGRPC